MKILRHDMPIGSMAVFAMILSACGSPHPSHQATQAPIGLVTFSAHDYGFSGPESLPAGLTTLRIVNQGHDLHHIQLIKLSEGKTAPDLSAAMKSIPGRLPIWAEQVGGPNATVPGEQADAMITLEPGEYVLICVIPDQKGVPHVALGMQKPLRVVPATMPPALEPHAALTVAMIDYGFALSDPIPAGTHTIKVMNNGQEPHEVVVVQLPPVVSVKDFGAAFAPGAAGPPPGKPIGGITGLERGHHGFFTTHFAPGNYGLICFEPDTSSGAPHFLRGMIMELTVK